MQDYLSGDTKPRGCAVCAGVWCLGWRCSAVMKSGRIAAWKLK